MTSTPLDFESDGGPVTCSDGQDNDADGPIDCDDSDCEKVYPCLRLAPAVTPTFLPVLILLLGFVGVMGLLRVTRQPLEE